MGSQGSNPFDRDRRTLPSKIGSGKAVARFSKMRRYLLASSMIGGSVTLVVLSLSFVGAFGPMVSWISGFYASVGLTGVDAVERASWLEVLTVIAGSFGMAWGVVDVSRLSQKIVIATSIILVTGAISPAFAFYGVLFDPFAPLTSVVLAAAAAAVYSGTESGMRKRVLEDLLGPRVSQATFDELLEAPSIPEFQGMVREVSVVTCRFFNHTELREKLEPAELLKMSNLFIRSASAFLISKGAYLDESSPELVRGSFGMLGRVGDHAGQACRAALELKARLRNLSQECETRWFQPLHFGIGIGTGQMTVGVYGSSHHGLFSAIGRETDFSRRLAQANLRYGSDVLIGPETYRLVQENFEVRPMEMFYDPASNSMTEIYQLLARRDGFPNEDRVRRDLFWQGIILMRERNFEAALDFFSRSRLPGSEDPPVAYYISRAQEGVAEPETRTSRLTREFAEEGHARLISLM